MNSHIFFAEFSFKKELNPEINERFFLFANLISSILIVSNENNLTESSLKYLIMVTTVKDNLLLEGENKKETNSEISFYFPNLVWVLKNTNFSVKDMEGNILNSNQYLKSFLKK